MRRALDPRRALGTERRRVRSGALSRRRGLPGAASPRGALLGRLAGDRRCRRRGRVRGRRAGCSALSPVARGSTAPGSSTVAALVGAHRLGRGLDRLVDRGRPQLGHGEPAPRLARLPRARRLLAARRAARGHAARGAVARARRGAGRRSAGRCSASRSPSLFPDGDRIARLREPFGHAPPLALLAGHRAAARGRPARGARRRRRVGRHAARLRRRRGAAPDPVARGPDRGGASSSCSGRSLSAEPRRCGSRASLPAVVPGLVVAAGRVHAAGARRGRRARADRVDAGVFAVARGRRARSSRSRSSCALPVDRLVAARGAPCAADAAARRSSVAALVVGRGRRARRRRRSVLRRRVRERPEPPHRRLRQQPPRLVGGGVARLHAPTRSPARAPARSRSRGRGVRDDADDVAEPHSVPLQLLADLGVVGLALALLAAVGLRGRAAGARSAGSRAPSGRPRRRSSRCRWRSRSTRCSTTTPTSSPSPRPCCSRRRRARCRPPGRAVAARVVAPARGRRCGAVVVAVARCCRPLRRAPSTARSRPYREAEATRRRAAADRAARARPALARGPLAQADAARRTTPPRGRRLRRRHRAAARERRRLVPARALPAHDAGQIVRRVPGAQPRVHARPDEPSRWVAGRAARPRPGRGQRGACERSRAGRVGGSARRG